MGGCISAPKDGSPPAPAGRGPSQQSSGASVPLRLESTRQRSAHDILEVQRTLSKVGELIGRFAEGRSDRVAPLIGLRKALQLVVDNTDADYASISLLSADGEDFAVLADVGSCTAATTQLPCVFRARGGSGSSMEALRAAMAAAAATQPAAEPANSGGSGLGPSGLRSGSSNGSLRDGALFVWQQGSGACLPTDWRSMHRAGLVEMWAAPILAGQQLLGAISIGYTTAGHAAAQGDHLLRAYVHLAAATLAGALADPTLTAYLGLVRQMGSCSNVDAVVQTALTHSKAALTHGRATRLWARIALVSTDGSAATLFDDLNQPGVVLSNQAKRTAREGTQATSASMRALHDIQAAGGILRTAVPIKGTILKIALSNKKQVVVPDVQKLINQMGYVNTDLFNSRLLKPPTSALIFPLRTSRISIFGALYLLTDQPNDFSDLSPRLKELCDLLGALMMQTLNLPSISPEFASIKTVTEGSIMDAPPAGGQAYASTNPLALATSGLGAVGALDRTIGSGSGARSNGSPMLLPYASLDGHLTDHAAMAASARDAYELGTCTVDNSMDWASENGSYTSAGMGSITYQQPVSSTGALVTGLTEKLNQKRIHACLEDAEAESLRDLQLGALIGEGGFARVFRGLWRGLVVAVKVVAVELGNEKSVLKNAHEIAILSTVGHPNIIQAYSCMTDVQLRDIATVCVKLGTPQQRAELLAALASSAAVSAATRKQQRMQQQHQHGGMSTASGATGATPPETDHAMCHIEVLEYCDLGSLATAMRAGVFAPPQYQAAAMQQRLAYNQMQALQQANGQQQPGAGRATRQDSVELPLVPRRLLDMVTLLRTLLETASAMAHLHKLGVVHCDLKPANILLKSSSNDARGFTIKLSDFGLSRIEDDADETMPPTFPFNSCGTAAYVAPEALVSQKKVNASVDVFAFGIIMWELYTGQRPYGALKQQVLVEEVVLRHLRPVFPPDAPAKYATLAAKCWGAAPADRPSFKIVMDELQAMLEDVEAGVLPSAVMPVGAPAAVVSAAMLANGSPGLPMQYGGQAEAGGGYFAYGPRPVMPYQQAAEGGLYVDQLMQLHQQQRYHTDLQGGQMRPMLPSQAGRLGREQLSAGVGPPIPAAAAATGPEATRRVPPRRATFSVSSTAAGRNAAAGAAPVSGSSGLVPGTSSSGIVVQASSGSFTHGTPHRQRTSSSGTPHGTTSTYNGSSRTHSYSGGSLGGGPSNEPAA